MNIPLNADVYCSNGLAGRSTILIINPINQEITHMVVKAKGLAQVEYLIPLELITESSSDTIQLRISLEALDGMEVFAKIRYLEVEENDEQYIPAEIKAESAMLWPYLTEEDVKRKLMLSDQLPQYEFAVNRGSHVEATDGFIGRVDEFLVNPADNRISHLVLRKGHLWDKENVVIPMSQIDRIEADKVYLKLSKSEVGKLPGKKVKRWWRAT